MKFLGTDTERPPCSRLPDRGQQGRLHGSLGSSFAQARPGAVSSDRDVHALERPIVWVKSKCDVMWEPNKLRGGGSACPRVSDNGVGGCVWKRRASHRGTEFGRRETALQIRALGRGGSQAATGVGVKDACLAETDGAESADEASWEGPWAFREAGR